MIRQETTDIKDKLAQAEQSFQEVFSADAPRAIQIYQTQKSYKRLFTPMILMWCLIFQRLNSDHTCDAVTAKIRSGSFDHLEQQTGKAPLSQRCLSESNAGYCQARKRIAIAMIEACLQSTIRWLRQMIVPMVEGIDRPVFLLDGSTVLLRPTAELEREYGRHKTAKKISYWVVIRIVVLCCLHSGGVAGLKEGSLKKSEIELGKACLRDQPAGGIYVADRGFGIFSIVQAVREATGDAIVRLSRMRAKKLFPQQLYPGMDLPVSWSHSKKDHIDPNMSSEPISGRLIYVRIDRPGFRSQDLYLFTTLLDRQAYPKSQIIQIYGLRWQVEVDLRYVKRTLDLYLLEGKSVDIIRKELTAGMLAYNLLRIFMILGAQHAGCSPIELSVSRCLRRVSSFLFDQCHTALHRTCALHSLIHRLAKCRLRQENQPRIEPRWVRPRDKSFPEFWDDRNSARVRFLQRRFEGAIW
jgi:hypothetical protein